MPVRRFRSMNSGGFDKVEGIGKTDSHEKGDDELAAVVAVEMDLREQIAQSDA